MDDYINNICGESRNHPDNWIKRKRNPGDPIQHKDYEVIDHRDSAESPTTEVYENYITGEAHAITDAGDLHDL